MGDLDARAAKHDRRGAVLLGRQFDRALDLRFLQTATLDHEMHVDLGEDLRVLVGALRMSGREPDPRLTRTAPPGGESFADACARIVPALESLAAGGGRIAVVAHAGTVRAALSRALGRPGAALAFRVAPLSLTRIILETSSLLIGRPHDQVQRTRFSYPSIGWPGRRRGELTCRGCVRSSTTLVQTKRLVPSHF